MDSFTTASELHSSTTGSLHSSPDQVSVVPSKPNNLQSKNFFDDFVIVPMLAEVKTPEFSKNRVDVNETANELEEILEPVSSVNPQSNTLIQKLISTLSGFTSPATVLNNLIARLKSINSISNNRPLASASETIEQITKHLRKHYPAPICLGKLPSEVADQLLGALSLHLNAFWSQASWKENGKYWQKEYSTEVMPLTDHTTDDSPHVTFLYAFEKLMMHFSSAKLASSGTGLSMLIRALLPFVALSSSASNFSSRHYLIDNLYDDICDMEENVLELLGGQMFNLTGLIKTAFEQFEVIQRQDGKEVNFLAPKFSNFYPNDDEVKEQLLAALGNAIKKWTKLLPKNDGKIDEGLLLLMCHQSIVSFEGKWRLLFTLSQVLT